MKIGNKVYLLAHWYLYYEGMDRAAINCIGQEQQRGSGVERVQGSSGRTRFQLG